WVFFGLHTLGLIVRWYISGHAPWSDAYESMIYVAWATMLFGLLFGRKSDLTMAATAFVTSMILMVAHWNWMDPAIANLQPVLVNGSRGCYCGQLWAFYLRDDFRSSLITTHDFHH